MKQKKLLLPAIVLILAVTGMILCGVVSGIAQKPVITQGEFPFSITYQLDGKTQTIEDVFHARFTGSGGYADTKSRLYDGYIANMEESGSNVYTLREDPRGSICLVTRLYPEHLMGDPMYDHFSREPFEPVLVFLDREGVEYADEQTLQAQGAKLISWEYPQPVENSFVFSHISRLNNQVVTPMLVTGLAALLIILLFVKKERDLQYQPVDRLSMGFNIAIGLVAVPFMTVYAWLSDINGGSGELPHQMAYVIPAFSVLCIAASVSLRRKGFGKSALAVTFAGPAAFALCIVMEIMLFLIH